MCKLLVLNSCIKEGRGREGGKREKREEWGSKRRKEKGEGEKSKELRWDERRESR